MGYLINIAFAVLGCDYTICAWIKPESLGGNRGQEIVFKARDGSDKEFIFHQNNGKLSLDVEKNANNRKAETTTLPVTTNIWQHVAVTFNSHSLTATFYHNGQFQPSTSNITALPDQLDDPLCIGRWGGTYNNYYFEGIIDEVTIYNRALSAEEIQVLMHTRPDTDDPNLVAYWDFDESEGQEVNDVSGNGNVGQLGSDPNVDDNDPNWTDDIPPVGICSVEGIVERNLLDVLGMKNDVLDILDEAIGKEEALWEYMDTVFKNRDFGNTSKGDVVKAKQKIHSAIQHEEQAEIDVDKSLDKLDDALNALDIELDDN